MITDGSPQGEAEGIVEQAAERIRSYETGQHVVFFAVGVGGADMARLKQLVVRTPLKLNGLNFREMFIWLSGSLQAVSQSKIDEQKALSPPGWGTTP